MRLHGRVGMSAFGLAGMGVVLCSLLGGCGVNSKPTANAPPPTPAVPPAAPALPGMNVPGIAPVATPGDLAQSATPPAATPPATVQPPSAPAAGVERTTAQAGVGAAGRSLDNETGVIVESAKALFAVRERAVFEISIPQALNLFQATEGRFPKSHDEFMERIINANAIRLPALPAGQRYIYDPQRNELMVERPASK